MAVTSVVQIKLNFSGDVTYGQEFEAPTANVASPGMIQTITLSSGNNSITVPSGATGVTIVPPEDNAQTLTLKGVNGDTGIALSMTDPMMLSLSGVSTFVLNAGGTITNLRLIWS